MRARSMDMTHRRPQRADGEHYELITAHQVLTLAKALQQWGHPHLVLEVMAWEPRCSTSEVESLRRVYLTNRKCLRDEAITTAAGNPFKQLQFAWEDLEMDFRRRIEQEEIYLRGVQVAPERRTDPEIIPGAWAAEFQFNFLTGTITVGELRYTAVACSLDPWTPERAQVAAHAQLPAPASTAETLARLRPEDFPAISDELLLALIEEHAQRVIKYGGPLKMPGKTTFLPIIRRKMRSRSEAGEMRGSITAEAAWLEEWIKDRVEGHQVPTAKTISKALGDDFNQLAKPRSTPAIQ